MAQRFVYTTKDGDVLDDILTRYYEGHGAALTHLVLGHNVGLAEIGPVYKAGLKIILPDLPKADVIPMIRPWGRVE